MQTKPQSLTLEVKGSPDYAKGPWKGILPVDSKKTVEVTGLNVVPKDGEGAFVLMAVKNTLGLLPPAAFKGALENGIAREWWDACLAVGGACEMELKPNPQFGLGVYYEYTGFPKSGEPMTVYACCVERGGSTQIPVIWLHDFRPGRMGQLVKIGQTALEADENGERWIKTQLKPRAAAKKPDTAVIGQNAPAAVA